VGVRLIVAYKGIKAVLEIALAVALVLVIRRGGLSGLQAAAESLEHHVTSRWSILVGRAIAKAVSGRGLHVVELGLALDGILSAVEGWSLWRGYRWGSWLVVVATATPLPLEVHHLARSHGFSRAVLVLLNVAVVVYLARRIARTPRG
jgi:uncharacterized membrane protein (DUF2068 family)